MFFKFFLCKYGYKAVSRRIFPFYVEFCGQILTIKLELVTGGMCKQLKL